jgi:hypothetical protein
MTKYKAIFRAVQHLTVTDYQLNRHVLRRAAGHRAADPRRTPAARRVDDARSSDDHVSGIALLLARSTLSSTALGSAEAAIQLSRRS